MNKNIDYYRLLNVPHTFEDKELKKNYRDLSKIHHPDKNKGDDTIFKLLSEAYKVLTKKDIKEKYDRESKYGSNYDPYLELLEFEFNNTNVSSVKVEDRMKEFKSDEMLHIVLKLDNFKDKIKYHRNIICSYCEGSGNVSAFSLGLKGKMGDLFDKEEIECDVCDGSGTYMGSECPGCKGEGYIKLGLSKCDKCNGHGIIKKEKKLILKESDFIDGKLMREFFGNQSKYNGKIGNLYISIESN